MAMAQTNWLKKFLVFFSLIFYYLLFLEESQLKFSASWKQSTTSEKCALNRIVSPSGTKETRLSKTGAAKMILVTFMCPSAELSFNSKLILDFFFFWNWAFLNWSLELSLKVRKSQNDFFKLTKNERTNSTLLLWNLRSTCFRSFLGRNWRHQKDISKLTDLILWW